MSACEAVRQLENEIKQLESEIQNLERQYRAVFDYGTRLNQRKVILQKKEMELRNVLPALSAQINSTKSTLASLEANWNEMHGKSVQKRSSLAHSVPAARNWIHTHQGALERFESTEYLQVDNNGWTRQDGTGFHQLVEEAIEDEYDQTALYDNPKRNREIENEKILSNGNRIDTLITKGDRGIIIDYKTHDMSDWKAADAIRYADEFGQQVREYTKMQSDGVPQNTQGYILLCNNLPKDKSIFDVFYNRLSKYDVSVEVADGEGVNAVTKSVGKIIKRHGL